MRFVTAACAVALVAALALVQLAELAEPGQYHASLPVVANGLDFGVSATGTPGTATLTPTSLPTITPTLGAATATPTSSPTNTPTPTNTIPGAAQYPVLNTPTPVTYPYWASPTPTLIPKSLATPYSAASSDVIVAACYADYDLTVNQRSFVVNVLVTQNVSGYATPVPLQGWVAQVDLIDRWAEVTPVGSSPTPTPVHRIFGPDPLMTPTFTPSPVPSATVTPTPSGSTPTPTSTPTNLAPLTTDSAGRVRVNTLVTDNGFRPLPDLRLVVGGQRFGTSTTVYIESILRQDDSTYQCR